MRMLSGNYRRRVRLAKAARQVADCGSLRNHVHMAAGTRTADYSEKDRRRLGDAVIAARRAAGHRYRPSFVTATGVGMRSLEAVELGEAVVGPVALGEVGRALGRFHPTWTADTPTEILRGGAAPPIEDITPRAVARRAEHAAVEIIQDPDKVGTDEWLEAAADLFEGDDLRDVIRVGLEARKRRRETREALEILLRQAAERARPSGASDDRSRVD